MKNTSRKLRTDFENAKIADFRDPENPNNEIVLLCEHATNELPDGYSWTENDRTYFTNTHWAYDPGSLDMAMYLAKELKCILVYSLYSRLLCDVNRDLTSDTLFRTNGDGNIVDLNVDLSYEEEQKRIMKYHHSYYTALREISMKINPSYIVAVHSFTPLYEGQTRTLEIGILVSLSEELAQKVHDGLKKRNHSVAVNEPYDGRQGLATLDAMLFGRYPVNRQGIEFEFRNDVLADPKKSLKIKMDTLASVKEACGLN